jgi:hypothetical protein
MSARSSKEFSIAELGVYLAAITAAQLQSRYGLVWRAVENIRVVHMGSFVTFVLCSIDVNIAV